MDLAKMLTELRNQRDQVEEAIAVLQRIAYGRGKRRGRPPKWMTEVKPEEGRRAVKTEQVGY